MVTSALLSTSYIELSLCRLNALQELQAYLDLQVNRLQVVLSLVLSAVKVHLDSTQCRQLGGKANRVSICTHSCFNCAISSFIRPSSASTSLRSAAVAERIAAVSFLVSTLISVRSSESAALKRYACYDPSTTLSNATQ